MNVFSDLLCTIHLFVFDCVVPHIGQAAPGVSFRYPCIYAFVVTSDESVL